MNYLVRRAQHRDLDTLVAFTSAEAREAEGLELDTGSVRSGVEAGLRDWAVVIYSLPFRTESRLVVESACDTSFEVALL